MKIPLALKIVLWILIPGATLWAGYEAYKYYKKTTAEKDKKPLYTGPIKTGETSTR